MKALFSSWGVQLDDKLVEMQCRCKHCFKEYAMGACLGVFRLRNLSGNRRHASTSNQLISILMTGWFVSYSVSYFHTGDQTRSGQEKFNAHLHTCWNVGLSSGWLNHFILLDRCCGKLLFAGRHHEFQPRLQRRASQRPLRKGQWRQWRCPRAWIWSLRRRYGFKGRQKELGHEGFGNQSP